MTEPGFDAENGQRGATDAYRGTLNATAAKGARMYSEVSNGNKEELVLNYVPLVKRIAHQLMMRMPASVQIEDLQQAGIIGLLEAANNFDGSKGASFDTYASIRIRGAMIDEVRRGDWAPRSVHRNARRITEAMQAVEMRIGADASDQQVADELGVSLEEYNAMLQDSASTRLFSLEELVNPENGNTPQEAILNAAENPLDEMQDSAFREQLVLAIGQLPEREQMVLALYYNEELNLKEIGLVLGVSESRVSQIHSQAAMRLRARLTAWVQSDEEH